MNKFIKKTNLFLIFAFVLVTLFNFSLTTTAKADTTNKIIKATLTKELVKANSTNASTIINDFQGVANYIHQYSYLPDNYITKRQANKLGWRPGSDLWKYAKGKSIGGDIFTNSEKCLPDAKGRIWHECDINYNGGHRGADRLLFSSDGLVYGTTDHYQTFTCYYGANGNSSSN
ncbi:ribonuclease (plasmid) [Clostridium estertheticum]|uniref:ribonuclease n=1 Tax=Clostridium estertheticum TaxID=238834 RepID=UPI001C7D9057|nr:ribonuclease [Clostridium estertheticum]MBX4260460.1 ribonuclease [Clostridium estertheticum]WLC72964.1 ribonuclease [Clostridium estertheticum]